MSSASGATPQLPLSLRYPPDQRLESFVAAPEGALDLLRALACRPGADWLYAEGAAGTGPESVRCVPAILPPSVVGREAESGSPT